MSDTIKDRFKHLNEDVQEQTAEGAWLPAIPLPLYTHGTGLKRLKQAFSCVCGRVYGTEVEYREHYRRMQLAEMNEVMSTRMQTYQGKALFWRRVTFVYRYAEPAEITNLEDTFDDESMHDGLWAEAANITDLVKLNEALENIWRPIYERTKAKSEAAEKADLAAAEDQSAAEAKDDFAEPFTHVNSKGVTYYLNAKDVTLRAGNKMKVYFFTKDFRPEYAQRKIPDGYKILENLRNGFLTVHWIDDNVQRGPEGSEDQ